MKVVLDVYKLICLETIMGVYKVVKCLGDKIKMQMTFEIEEGNLEISVRKGVLFNQNRCIRNTV